MGFYTMEIKFLVKYKMISARIQDEETSYPALSTKGSTVLEKKGFWGSAWLLSHPLRFFGSQMGSTA
jgi:hypothetical protein